MTFEQRNLAGERRGEIPFADCRVKRRRKIRAAIHHRVHGGWFDSLILQKFSPPKTPENQQSPVDFGKTGGF